jgi:hypothetical protein
MESVEIVSRRRRQLSLQCRVAGIYQHTWRSNSAASQPFYILLHLFSVCDLLYLFFHSSPFIFPHWQLMIGGSSFFIFWTRRGLTAAKA